MKLGDSLWSLKKDKDIHLELVCHGCYRRRANFMVRIKKDSATIPLCYECKKEKDRREQKGNKIQEK